MTTIATDGYEIAADSMVSHNENHLANRNKLVKLADGSVVAGAGNSDEIHKAIDNLDTDDDSEGEFTLLRLWPDGRIGHYARQTLHPTFLKPPAAIGSGGELALGALLAGASPVRAVKLAAKVDLHTGGPVKSIWVRH